MKKQDYVNYWVKTSADDLSSMESIFGAGNNDWALFIGHLCLEKILKALWVKNNETDFPPRTHNLKKLADEAKFSMGEGDSIKLLEINDFNIEARYPDYKSDFYKKCSKEFTIAYITQIKELYQCILSQI